MQRITTVLTKASKSTSSCQKVLSRSFADAPPKIPRKATSGVVPPKAGEGAIPRKSTNTQKVSTKMSNKVAYPLYGTAGVVTGLALYEVFRCTKSDNTFVAQLKSDLNAIKDMIVGLRKEVTEITANDLPPARIGPDGKPIRTLIIDLEDTLITEEWDSVNGTRHVKRPGVDKMLLYLSSMYEIYIISDYDLNAAMNIVMEVDKNHVCNYLFSDAMKLRNGTRVKDISYFSRDPKRVIVVDNNINANEHKENVAVVKPFKNIHGTKDTTLLDLIPILEEIFIDDVDDVRDYLKQFEEKDIIDGYRKIAKEKEEKEKEERQKAFLQQINVFKPSKEDEESSTGSILLADPELEGIAPALAASNMQNMMESGHGAFVPDEKLIHQDHLKYIPVEINGEKPEGFTTYWQREYMKKKEAMIEQQRKMLEMQNIAMQELSSQNE